MRINCGTDIIEISRLKKAIDTKGEKFLKKIYTENEISYCENKKNAKYESYAVRFSAKEAIYKALSEIANIQMSWQDVEIINNANNKPEVVFLNKKIDNIQSIDISLSHCHDYAVATVVVLSN